jgi:hypothetical protein
VASFCRFLIIKRAMSTSLLFYICEASEECFTVYAQNRKLQTVLFIFDEDVPFCSKSAMHT